MMCWTPKNAWNSLEFPKIDTSYPKQPPWVSNQECPNLVAVKHSWFSSPSCRKNSRCRRFQLFYLQFLVESWDLMDFTFFEMKAVSWLSKMKGKRNFCHSGARGGACHSVESGEIWSFRGGESPHWPWAAGKLSRGQLLVYRSHWMGNMMTQRSWDILGYPILRTQRMGSRGPGEVNFHGWGQSRLTSWWKASFSAAALAHTWRCGSEARGGIGTIGIDRLALLRPEVFEPIFWTTDIYIYIII